MFHWTNPADSRILRALRLAAHGLRGACLVAALSFAALLLVELAYRFYEHFRPARPAAEVMAPVDREPWFATWLEIRYRHVFGIFAVPDPYRGWWVRPGHYEGFLTIEPSGYRRTVQTLQGEPAARRHVFLFGGSTMWGFTARDPATIPSFVAAQLGAAGVRDVEIHNKAQSAYNLTQGLATLELELRRGARPVAAVFLDGVNEVGVAVNGEQPGDVYGQRKWRERFQPMRARDMLPWLASKLHVVEALRSSLAEDLELPPGKIDAACRTVADYYANLVRIGEALGREFGFKVYFFWQPTVAMSGKTPGPFEAQILAEQGHSASMMKAVRVCSREVDARLEQRRGSTFFALHALYDRTQGDVFVDHYGHVVEQANADIAAAITERLLPDLK